MAKNLSKKIYHIICEGSTEEAYLQELNRYIRECDCPDFYFMSYNINGFSVNKIINKYKEVKGKIKKDVKQNKQQMKEVKDEIYIWLDDDIFIRAQGKPLKDKLVLKLNGFAGIKYNCHNGEDFLVMHLPNKLVQDWHRICVANNHFAVPMFADKVEKLIKSIFPKYSRGNCTKKNPNK